ncbi:cysteine desulfurase [Roseiarcus fermentans]|uniref:Cysteine desulfurase n=1 Tax=Roseiarcus fermentans TaxID=1473586 RepID=A0A366FDY4_9HYPH|nr:cysteine desulfurase family protein [Roseiarcus fermentans]RBP12817.1 cysteine desulfurase [Roseiarcus fermentans]
MVAERPIRTYLDYNATAPLRREARAAVVAALDTAGNPSSVHAEGRAARQLVETARADVGRLAGVPARCVTFVSGATEAANAALNPRLGLGPAEPPLERLIVSAGEHPCVLHGHRFPPSAVETAPLLGDGRIDLDWLADACRRPGRALLALQGANNETGVVQPVAAAAAIVHAAGGFVFCDAVQLAGRVAFSLAGLGADALALSAHKLGGPKGAGALISASAGTSLGHPLLRGGGQERGVRAGTENVASIAGFGAAAEIAAIEAADETPRLAALRQRLADAVREAAPDAVEFGRDAPRLANTLCFAVPGIEASTLMIALDLAGVAVSSGAACSSGKVAPSHVLAAMGVAPDLARGAIRLSVGWGSTERDVERFSAAFCAAARRIRAGRSRVADLASEAGRV